MPYPEFGGNPLVSDERTRPANPTEFGANPAGLDMRGAPAGPLGLQGMPNIAGFQQRLNELNSQPLLQPSAPSTEAQMYYSPSTGEMVVNGFAFNQRNATQGLASEEFARQPRREFTLPDTATDWRPMSAPEYANYIDGIRNPSFMTRMDEANEHAWRGVGDIALGASLAVNPEWEWAQQARQNILREYEENAPFMMQLRDIQNPGDALTYASQMLIQGGPWIVETLASMGIGAVVGGAVSGGVGAPVGAVEAFVAKEALRQGTIRAIRQNLARGAAAYRSAAVAAGRNQLTRDEVIAHVGADAADDVNRFFNFAERSYHLSRGAAQHGNVLGSTGAMVGSGVSNYMTGVGDIRNSIADAGGDPTSAEAIGQIWGMAIPYAALESVGDLILTQPLTQAIPGMGVGPSRAGNALRGAATNFASEAVQETSQYGITQNAAAEVTGTPLSLEPMDLLATAIGGGLGGAGVGGLVGLIGPTSPRPDTSTVLPETPRPLYSPEQRSTLNRLSGRLDGIRRMQDPNNPMGADDGSMGGLTPPDMGYEANPFPDFGEVLNPYAITGTPLPPSPQANLESERARYREEGNLPAYEALQGGRDVDREAADRGTPGPGGMILDDDRFIGPPNLGAPISDYELHGLQSDITRSQAMQSMDRSSVDLPTGLEAEAIRIFQDLALNPESVSEDDVNKLREAITVLQKQNPSEWRYADVLRQLDDMKPYTGGVTERPDWMGPEPEPYVSPMEAARAPGFLEQMQSQQAERNAQKAAEVQAGTKGVQRAGPLRPVDKSKLKPAITPAEAERLQREANERRAGKAPTKTDSLASKADEAKAEAIVPKESAEDLLTRTYQMKGKFDELSDEELNRVMQITARKKGKTAHGELHAKLKEEQLARAVKKGGRARNRAKKTLKKTGDDRTIMGSMVVKPVKEEAEPVKGETKAVPKEEKKDAVPERSPEEVPVREQTGTSKKDGSGDAARDEAPSKSPDTKGTESVQREPVTDPNDEEVIIKAGLFIVSRARIDKAWAAAVASPEYPNLYSFKQSASGIASHNTKIDVEAPVKTRQPWAIVDGKALSRIELSAIQQRMKRLGVDNNNVNGVQTKEEKAERAAVVFGEHLAAAFRRGAADFKSFVFDRINKKELDAWMDSKDAKETRLALRGHVERLIRDNPLDVKRALPIADASGERGPVQKYMDSAVWGEDVDKAERKARNAMRDVLSRYAEKVHHFKLNNLGRDKAEPALYIVTDKGLTYKYQTPTTTSFIGAMRRIINLRDPKTKALDQNRRFESDFMNAGNVAIIESSPGLLEVRLPQQLDAETVRHLTEMVDVLPHDNARAVQFGREGQISRVSGKAAVLDTIQSTRDYTGNARLAIGTSIGEDNSKNLGLGRLKVIVNTAVNRINPTIKPRTTHVYVSLQALKDNKNKDTVIGPDGKTYTINEIFDMHTASTGKTVDELIDQAFYEAKAAVIPAFNALFVFKNALRTGTEREAVATLEHEIIGHYGLSALFENDIELSKFLTRLGAIPGMEDKRQNLLTLAPGYRTTSYLWHLEELVCFRAMEGPLALEALLSAKEAIDPATKRTLWEDFVSLVRKWLEVLFGREYSQADNALDIVVAGLREHAILGTKVDLNERLDWINAPSFDEAAKLIPGANTLIPRLDVKRAIATANEVNEMLYGTNDNPGLPYTENPWAIDMLNTFKGHGPLIEKMKEAASRGVGTTTREAWRKFGRNIEPMMNMALRSTLVEKLMDMMDNTISVARRIMTKRQETRKYASVSKAFDKVNGSTQAERNAYNRMAIIATNGKLPLVSEEVVRNSPRLVVRDAVGMYSINMAVFGELLTKGTYSKEDFVNGIEQFTVYDDGQTNPAGTAKVTQEMADLGYPMYLAETRHMAESALETLEHAIFALNQMNDTTVARILYENRFADHDKAFADEVLSRMYKLYADIAFQDRGKASRDARARQQDIAKEVLAELMRSMHSKEKLEDWTDAAKTRPDKAPRKQDAFSWREQVAPEKQVEPYTAQIAWFLANDPATGKSRLARLHDIYTGRYGDKADSQFQMLGAFQHLLNTETQMYEHENETIQSVLGNYVEFTRKGQWRVFVRVLEANPDGTTKTDNNGNPVQADVNPELLSILPAVYPKGQREAIALQQELSEKFDGLYQHVDKKGEKTAIKFDVGYEKAPGTRTLAEAPKIKEFLKVADVLGMKLSATQMKEITNLIENAAGRKRYGLQRAGMPGMDIDILKNNSETMTQRAWRAAKTSQAWMIDTIFADKKNVYGDWDHLADLQRAFDIANRGAPEGENPPTSFVRNEADVYLAEAALLRYANQLRYMSKHTVARPTVNVRTTKGEQKFKIEPEGQAHHAHAIALKESLEKGDLELNLNDLLSKTGPLRMLSVVLQLGSIASAIMQVTSVITHLPQVLMARHAQTGYGEGFTFSETVSEIMAAMADVMLRFNMQDSAKLLAILEKAKAGNNETSLTIPELQMMYDETLEGELAAQQTYSMTGGTESNIGSVFLRNVAEAFLKPFGHMESANRRVSALATYRLAKRRYIAAGVDPAKLEDPASPEYKRLRGDVKRVIQTSQGYYANINRPKVGRGDLAQYVFQYKMFPLMTVFMLHNLPKAQQAAFLGILFLLGGLKAEPFADDFMDLYDTLMQKLGFRHDSVELSMIRTLEEIMPGSSKWIMNGAIDSLAFGGTMSSRISMGDIIPFTGAFREGADLNREMIAAFGPAYAGNAAAFEYAWLLTNFTMQTMGLRPSVNSWEDLIRKMPQSQLRGIGEAGLMAATGEITDPRGRLVSDEVTMFNIFSRALGFYPLEATKANTAVRLDRMHIGYMRTVRANFVLAYANAYRADDQDRMDSIVDQVAEWNAAAEEAGQEDMLIRNFRSAARRAGRAASQTTIERTSEGAPDYSLIDELAGILNADEESED